MHAEWTDHLSAYLDDELAAQPRAALEQHLAGCAECALVLAELRAVTVWAGSYRGRAPTRDLWPAVQGRIDERKVAPIRRMAGGAWRQLIAAGIAVVAVGGGALWLGTRGQAPPPVPDVPFVASAASIGDADVAVRDLEALLDASRAELDTSTVRVIEESLQLIDLAIAEARAAFQRDSSNQYLTGRIATHLKQKLAILRTATRAARDL